MRAAPAIDAALSAARVARAWVALLHLAGALVLVAWAEGWGWLPVAWPVAIAVVGLPAWALGVWQARQWLPRAPQRLRWDGQAWSLLSPGRSVTLSAVAVQIDLGSALLLRLQPASPGQAACWAWATPRAAAGDWHGLRVALRHHAGAAVAHPADGRPEAGAAR
ncbi:hypothetical protein AACH10_06665 [Ideonella sp. DXS22W]|uniref:Toxin CptA n=1 Tax=Pseudaquabacterium inlustre TaxID=2984192 RepID=A0ABU9CDF9_9BURK